MVLARLMLLFRRSGEEKFMRIRLTSLALAFILVMGLVACATPDIPEPEPDIPLEQEPEVIPEPEPDTDTLFGAINNAIAGVDRSERVMDIAILDDGRDDYFGVSVRLVLTDHPGNGYVDFADDVEYTLPAIRMVFLVRGIQFASVEFIAIASDDPDNILRWYSSDGLVGDYYSLAHGRNATFSDIRWDELPQRIEFYLEDVERVKNVELSIDMPTWSIVGIYSGDVVNGIPHGHGVFTTPDQTFEGYYWTYTGEFKNGQFHGYGMTEWETGSREEGFYQFGRIINGRRYNAAGELSTRIINAGARRVEGVIDEWTALREEWSRWLDEIANRPRPRVETFNFADYGWILEEHPSDIVLGPIENEEMVIAVVVESWVELFGDTSDMERWWRWRLLEYSGIETKSYEILYDESNDVWFLAGVFPPDVLSGITPFIFIRGTDGQVLAAWWA